MEHTDTTTTFRQISRIEDIFLHGNCSDGSLRLEVTTVFYDKKKVAGNHPFTTKKWTESKVYPLRNVTPKELYQIRLTGKPGLVYKKNNMFFFAEIPSDLPLNRHSDNFGKHLCGRNCSQVCKGCPRTNDLTAAYQQRIGKKFSAAVDASWRIEKYAFISEGIETFNMKKSNDSFIVLRCSNFYATHPMNEVRKPTVQQKLALASFYWDGFDGTRSDMLERIHQNEKKYGEFGASD